MVKCLKCGRYFSTFHEGWYNHPVNCVPDKSVCNCEKQEDGHRVNATQDTVDKGIRMGGKAYSAPSERYLDAIVKEHWDWLQGIFVWGAPGKDEIDLKLFEYLYKTAMKHGWKHCKEYYNIGVDDGCEGDGSWEGPTPTVQDEW